MTKRSCAGEKTPTGCCPCAWPKRVDAKEEEVLQSVVAEESVEYVGRVIDLDSKEYGLVNLAAMSICGECRSHSSMKSLVRSHNDKHGRSRENLEFLYAHISETEAHCEPVFDMVREYATKDERQQKTGDNVKIWCDRFQTAQEGSYRLAMGVDASARVDLQ